MKSAPLRIHFRRFFRDFDPMQFWIPLIEEAAGTEAKISSAAEADVVVTSVFESFGETWRRRLASRSAHPLLPSAPRLGSTKAKSIWVTGENIRPPINGYDLTFSFDLDDFGGTNLYLPLLLTELDWFPQRRRGRSQSHNHRTGMRWLLPVEPSKRREVDTFNRPKFACAFIGNAEPVRMRAITALGKIGQVDVFGAAVGRPTPNKADVAREYRFMLCFENSLYPGYITEKVLDAYQCGCIPLWRGIDESNLLNSSALVNQREATDLEDFAHRVAALDSSKTAIHEMSSEPLFNSEPSLHASVSAIRNLLYS